MLTWAPWRATTPVKPLVTSKSTRETPPTPTIVTASCPPPSMIAVPTPFNVRPSEVITIGPAQTPVKVTVRSGSLTPRTASASDFLLQSRGVLLSACAAAAAANANRATSQTRKFRIECPPAEREDYGSNLQDTSTASSCPGAPGPPTTELARVETRVREAPSFQLV